MSIRSRFRMFWYYGKTVSFLYGFCFYLKKYGLPVMPRDRLDVSILCSLFQNIGHRWGITKIAEVGMGDYVCFDDVTVATEDFPKILEEAKELLLEQKYRESRRMFRLGFITKKDYGWIEKGEYKDFKRTLGWKVTFEIPTLCSPS